MKKQQPEPEAGSIELYIHRLIQTCEEKLNDKSNPPTLATFQYYTGARNFLYMVLTGHSNVQTNPKVIDMFASFKDSSIFKKAQSNENDNF
jgi:hypothetical protein